MGMSTTHDAYQGSCGSFNHFRSELAAIIGVHLFSMDGFGGTGDWAAVDDDLKILLDHEDNDGIISVEDCGRLALRLRQILATMDKPVYRNDERSLYEFTEDFAKGCELAHSRGETMRFG